MVIKVVAIFRDVTNIDKVAQLAREVEKWKWELGWHTDDLRGGDPRSG